VLRFPDADSAGPAGPCAAGTSSAGCLWGGEDGCDRAPRVTPQPAGSGRPHGPPARRAGEQGLLLCACLVQLFPFQALLCLLSARTPKPGPSSTPVPTVLWLAASSMLHPELGSVLPPSSPTARAPGEGCEVGEQRPAGSFQALVCLEPSNAPRAEQSSAQPRACRDRGSAQLSRSLTCPSRSAGASRSAGGASGPGEPRWPRCRTCCWTGSPCSWARGRGRWWHCGRSRRRVLPTEHSHAETRGRAQGAGSRLPPGLLHRRGAEPRRGRPPGSPQQPSTREPRARLGFALFRVHTHPLTSTRNVCNSPSLTCLISEY